MIMQREAQKITPFYEDVYLYDLNQPEMPPLSYRSARGGEAQPDLLTLIDLPARACDVVAEQLYDRPAYLSANGGAVLLPVQGSIGRFVVVVKTSLSLPALSYLVQCAGQSAVYADVHIKETLPKLTDPEREAVESAMWTVTGLRLLIEACELSPSIFEAEECIRKAADIMGVSLMPREKVETALMQEQKILPEMQHSGQVLFVCVFTFLSVMRNCAHARSGWLYTTPEDGGYALQVFLRCNAHADLEALIRLRTLLEDGGVAIGARTFVSSIKPPKQYAYLHRKITDPRKPLCARCQCLDTRCASCTVTAWAVLPYVCDAALLGIKAMPRFEK